MGILGKSWLGARFTVCDLAGGKMPLYVYASFALTSPPGGKPTVTSCPAWWERRNASRKPPLSSPYPPKRAHHLCGQDGSQWPLRRLATPPARHRCERWNLIWMGVWTRHRLTGQLAWLDGHYDLDERTDGTGEGPQPTRAWRPMLEAAEKPALNQEPERFARTSRSGFCRLILQIRFRGVA